MMLIRLSLGLESCRGTSSLYREEASPSDIMYVCVSSSLRPPTPNFAEEFCLIVLLEFVQRGHARSQTKVPENGTR